MEAGHRNTSRPRVLIADDPRDFRRGTLRTYLEKTFTRHWGRRRWRGYAVQEAIKLRPEVVITDVAMPLLNGLDAARKIREQAPKIAFVFLTMLDDANLAAAALELGSAAFLLKCSGGEVNCTQGDGGRFLHGRSYLTPKLRA